MHGYSHFSCQDLSGEKEQKQGLKVYKKEKVWKECKIKRRRTRAAGFGFARRGCKAVEHI